MLKFLSNAYARFKSLWSNLSKIQRLIAIVVSVLFVGGILAVSLASTRDDKVFLFTNPITDVDLLNRITVRLDEEDFVYTVDSSNRIQVQDKRTARYLRNILIREDLLPKDTDPWELFDISRWTQTDFERNVNLRRSITRQLEQHIESLDDVDNAKVTLVMPEDTLFVSDRNPVTASVILSIKPGADLRENRSKVEGLERLVMLAVEGLLQENIVINDSTGVQLNDFENLQDFDSLELTKRELKIKASEEKKYKEAIYNMLADVYTADRVRIININLEMDFSKKSQETTENYPIVVKKDNPATPFDESEVVLSVPRSKEIIAQKYTGTGFNPEGPPGVEGQVPPSYKDLDGIVGSWTHNSDRINNEINQRVIVEERRPYIRRVTASVAIDGVWRKLYDENGIVKFENNSIVREYTPLTKEELRQAKSLIEDAVGYFRDRNDSVSVENVRFDRSAEFQKEDIKERRKVLFYKVTTYTGIAIIILIVVLILFRMVARSIEAIKRKREEMLADQYRRMREQQISALSEEPEKEEETELERMTKDMIEIAKNNPGDVAKLIKVWAGG